MLRLHLVYLRMNINSVYIFRISTACVKKINYKVEVVRCLRKLLKRHKTRNKSFITRLNNALHLNFQNIVFYLLSLMPVHTYNHWFT